jgi:hypothetical protein
MRMRRDVSSIPHRSASETWEQITKLITGPKSLYANQLEAAAGVMASIITDEHPGAAAIMIEGVGPQLRIYCRYGMRAIEEGNRLDPLTWNPTAGDWTMHVPCDSENIEWVRKSLAKWSPRINVFDLEEADRAGREDQNNSSNRKVQEIAVDWNFGG